MIISSRIRSVATSSVIAAAVVVTMVEPAFAQAAGIETVLQNIVDMLTGNIAKLLAVIAVIVICIAWMFGWRLKVFVGSSQRSISDPADTRWIA